MPCCRSHCAIIVCRITLCNRMPALSRSCCADCIDDAVLSISYRIASYRIASYRITRPCAMLCYTPCRRPRSRPMTHTHRRARTRARTHAHSFTRSGMWTGAKKMHACSKMHAHTSARARARTNTHTRAHARTYERAREHTHTHAKRNGARKTNWSTGT